MVNLGVERGTSNAQKSRLKLPQPPAGAGDTAGRTDSEPVVAEFNRYVMLMVTIGPMANHCSSDPGSGGISGTMLNCKGKKHAPRENSVLPVKKKKDSSPESSSMQMRHTQACNANINKEHQKHWKHWKSWEHQALHCICLQRGAHQG